MTSETEAKQSWMYLYILIAVIVVIAILRIFEVGLTGAKPLKDTTIGPILAIASIFIVGGIIWWFRNKRLK